MDPVTNLRNEICTFLTRYESEKGNDALMLTKVFTTMKDSIDCMEDREDIKLRMDCLQNAIEEAKPYLTSYQLETVNNMVKRLKTVIQKTAQKKSRLLFTRNHSDSPQAASKTNMLFRNTVHSSSHSNSRSDPSDPSCSVPTNPIFPATRPCKQNYISAPFVLDSINPMHTLLHCKEDVIKLTHIKESILIVEDKKKSIHIHSISDSVIVLKEVDGSVMIHNAKSCLFFVNCQQIRIHSSTDCCFSLQIPNHPIIEDCDAVWFSTFALSWKESPTIQISENLYHAVLDFKWLKQNKSPHWDTISVHDFLHDHPALCSFCEDIPNLTNATLVERWVVC